MKKIKRTLLVIAAAMAGFSQANALNVWGWDTGGMASALLRWDRAADPDNVTYRVLRDGHEVGTGLVRCQFIDMGVTEGNHNWTVEVYKSGSRVDSGTKTIYVGARDYSKKLYSLDVEYEVTLDELMSEGINVDAYSLQTSSSSIKVPGKGFVNTSGNNKIKMSSWKDMGRMSDSYNTQFRTYSHWPSDNANDYILDGNRYLWLKDMKRFTVKGDWLENGEWVAADAYPWAGHGYSWRASDSGVSGVNGETGETGYYERCWYIAMKEPASSISDNLGENQPFTDGKYGVLCVWGPDKLGHRPYGGAPMFLSYSQFYRYLPDRNGKNETLEAEFTKPNGKASKYYKDKDWTFYNNSSYGLAFSEDGRSFIHRTGDKYDGGYTGAPNRDQFWLVHPAKEDGSQHMWSPRRNGSTHNYGSKVLELPRAPGRRCDLPNVKGNLQYFGDTNDQNGSQQFAWLWLIPRYTNSTDAINVRRERIINHNNASTASGTGYGYNRINISGWNAKGGMTCDQSYVIPMAGYEREDVFFQFHQNKNTNIKPLYYMGHNRLKNMPWGQGTTTGDAWEQKITVNDLQEIDLGVDHFDTAGGCTFEFQGNRFLVLPANRLNNRNFGDFSIYRIDVNDGAGTVNLVPVYDYKVEKESYRWEKDNVHRVFFKAYSYDNEVQIFSYLPGRQIRMYTFHPYDVNPATPYVNVYPEFRELPDSYKKQGKNNTYTHDGAGYYKDFNHFVADGTWSEPGSAGRWDDSWNGWQNTAKDGWYIWKYNTGWYNNGNWIAGDNYFDRNWNRQYTKNDTDVNSGTYKLMVQPIYRRRHHGQYEHAVGQPREASDNFRYDPVAPTVTVEVFEGTGDVSDLYRVDLYFTKCEAWSEGHRMSPTRYEVSYGPKNQPQDNNTCSPTLSKTPGMPIDGKCMINYGWTNTYDGGVHNEKVGNTSSWVNVLGDYNFDQSNNWPMRHGESNNTTCEPNSNSTVLSFFVKKDSGFNPFDYTYHVKACYGGDNWGNGDVAKAVVGSANPTYSGTTSIDDITVENGNAKYYNLQGIEVSPEEMTAGVYIVKDAKGSRKVVVQ